ncbi:MAG: antibiotic biosynthesis monooxygenase [Prolixibacteraceae bacterium]
MFQVIWELKVKFKEREKFEKFYDPKGDWVKFFSQSSEYEGTEVLESGEGDGIFLVIDEWQSEEAFNEFVKSRKAGFDLLEEKAKAASRTKKRIWIAG